MWGNCCAWENGEGAMVELLSPGASYWACMHSMGTEVAACTASTH